MQPERSADVIPMAVLPSTLGTFSSMVECLRLAIIFLGGPVFPTGQSGKI